MTPSGFALRPAAAGDLAEIMALETRIFVNDAWSVPSMRAEIESPHGRYLVATAEEGVPQADGDGSAAGGAAPGTVVGYAGLRAPEGAGQADIQTIAVAETARRCGVGRALMTALMAEAARRGARELFLEVRADNPPAQRLYRDLGFAEIGVRPKYYQPDGVDALVMRAELGEAG